MAYWLLKTEPTAYSFADLQRDKKATWDGVTNALALKHVRAMKVGDEAIIYHTGDEKQAVGTAKVVKAHYVDPNENDPKLAVVDLQVGKALKRAVTLAEMKADKRFAGWDLLRIGRLSVVPATAEQWAAVMTIADGK